MVPLRYRIKSVVTRFSFFQIALIAAIALWIYIETQSWIRVGLSVGVMIAIGILLRFSTFIVDWLVQAVSPNAVQQTDARGKRVDVAFGKWDQLELTDVERIRLAIWLDRNKPPKWLLWLNVGLIAGLIGFSIVLHSVLRLDQVTSWVVFGVSAVPAIVLLRRFAMRRYSAWQAAALVSIGRCPACKYDLKRLNAEPDGCTICSECGSAWQKQ